MSSGRKNNQRRNSKSLPFNERWDVEVGLDQARQHFVNRSYNYIFDNLLQNDNGSAMTIQFQIANAFGMKVYRYNKFEYYIEDDFFKCLHALEVAYRASDTSAKAQLTGIIDALLIGESSIDLGISWQPPVFVPTGAEFLDEQLINESLRWLSDSKYSTVYDPFEKALGHFVESMQKPHLLADVITDMYEALEALAKIVTGRGNKDLSANRDKFVSELDISDQYKKLLKEYIAYANEFRHAASESRAKPTPSRTEVESFIYLTGLFIRLAVHRS